MTKTSATAVQPGDTIEIPAGVDPRRKATYRMLVAAVEHEAGAPSFISGTVVTKAGRATVRSNFGSERWTQVNLADCTIVESAAALAIDEQRRQVEMSSGAAAWGER